MKHNKIKRTISAVLSTITIAALTSVSVFAANAAGSYEAAPANSRTIAKVYVNGKEIEYNGNINELLSKYNINAANLGADCNIVWQAPQNTGKAPAENTCKAPDENTGKAPAENTGKSPAENTGKSPAENTGKSPAENTGKAPDEAPASAGSSVLAIEREVVALVNAVRAENGLSALSLNEELSAVARVKAEDMSSNRYFSHTSPTYGSPFDMMNKFGISYRTAGENIAMGFSTAQSVLDGWMNSPGHRANILNASFTQIGVGYTANGNYWCQMFIG